MRFIYLLLFIFATAQAAAPAPKPFWRVKEKVLKKIVEDRAIIVSVNATKKSDKLSVLTMEGGGRVKLPAARAFHESQKFENLKSVSDHVVESKYDAARKELHIHTQAFRYHADMYMAIDFVESAVEESKIKFKVVRGEFTGMTGQFSFEDFANNTTLLGFNATYEYEKLPMPEFFIEFGLEIVLQKVASAMRTFLEKQPAL
jgi:hypothetical protein